MRGLYIIIIVTVLLSNAGCEEADKLNEFLREAPVEPLADIIRTSVPIGYCAVLAMADHRGFEIPHESLPMGSGLSLIRITDLDIFPLVYLGEDIKELIILSFPADDDFTIISIFYMTGIPEGIMGHIKGFNTIPVIIEEGMIKAVFASQDIYVSDDMELELHMGPAEIWIEMGRAKKPRPESTEAAIGQNAWIINIDPSGTWDIFFDDDYTITGGMQDVSAFSSQYADHSGIIQLAMIGSRIRWDCMLAPYDGFAVLHEIEITSSRRDNLEDLVLGSVFYEFIPECTGMVRIPLASGNFLMCTGRQIQLGLLE